MEFFLQETSNLYKLQWQLYVPPALKFRKFVFCPQRVFMHFIRFSGQIDINIAINPRFVKL